MLSPAERELFEHLREFLTPARRARFEAVLARRTRMLTVVLEDVFQPHNRSAVLRTAEAVGLQDVHIVESSHRMEIDREISMGCDRWLSIHRHRDNDAEAGIVRCLRQLRREGFRILVSTPHAPATPLSEVHIDQPTALVIGHETVGVSDIALSLADERLAIPMWGFVESLNLSVAAAVSLYELRSALDRSGMDWTLDADDADKLRFDWTRRSIPNVEAFERRYGEERQRVIESDAPVHTANCPKSLPVRS